MTPTMNGTATSPAEALLQRKLKMAAQFECRTVLEQLERVDAELVGVLAEIDQTSLALTRAKADLEDITAMQPFVEGKNAEERTQKRAAALATDESYLAGKRIVTALENERVQQQSTAERLKRAAKRLELTINYRVGVLTFLSG